MGQNVNVPKFQQPATVQQGNQAATNAVNMRLIQQRLAGRMSTITNQMAPFGKMPGGLGAPPMAIPGR